MVTRSLFVIALCICAAVSWSACFYKPVKKLIKPSTDPIYVPRQIQARSKHANERHVAKVRVVGDHEFRAQQVDWKREVTRIIDDANQMLVPEFGVRLEVVEFQEWTRQTPSRDLDGMLAELEQRDAGADVDWVVGMVSALSDVSNDITQLGVARPLSKHFILRGYNDVAEFKELKEEIDANVRAARKQHKQKAVFLHEFGHTLGALHVSEMREALMHGTYRVKMSGFSAPNSALIAQVLAERMQRPADIVREARAMQKVIDIDEPWPGWVAADRERAVEMVESIASSDGAGQPGGQGGSGDLDKQGKSDKTASATSRPRISPQAGILYRRVGELIRKGDMDTAWTELQALMQSYPAHAEFRMTACLLWMQREPLGAQALEHCKRVGELEPTNPSGELVLVQAYVKDNKLLEAHAILQGILARVPNLPDDQKDKQQALWNSVVAVYRGLSAVTWAEAAVATAPPSVDTKAVRPWALTTRRRYGLPRNGKPHGILPEREGEYVAQVRAVLKLTYGKDYKRARKLARRGLRRFRNGPGFLGALCDLEYRARNYPSAYGRCSSALRYFGDASWSRYLMGILELRKKRNRAGIKHLKLAIVNDPDLKQAYHALYKAYVRVKNQKAMNELRATYFERFRVALPTR